MRVIVTGSRDWPDDDDLPIYAMLEGLRAQEHIYIVVGCAPGVDAITHRFFADAHTRTDTYYETFRALWDRHGKAAGPIRNQEMIDSGADLCLAFFNGERSKGTADCVRRARKAGIPVYEVWRTH